MNTGYCNNRVRQAHLPPAHTRGHNTLTFLPSSAPTRFPSQSPSLLFRTATSGHHQSSFISSVDLCTCKATNNSSWALTFLLLHSLANRNKGSNQHFQLDYLTCHAGGHRKERWDRGVSSDTNYHRSVTNPGHYYRDFVARLKCRCADQSLLDSARFDTLRLWWTNTSLSGSFGRRNIAPFRFAQPYITVT